jgi:hypothetical protein
VSDAQDKLARLQGERAELEVTRTREDIKALAESWLVAGVAAVNGSTRLALNQHARAENVAAVLQEFDLKTKGPGVVDFIVAENTPRDALTDRAKKQRLGKLDAEIKKASDEVRKEAKAEALAEIEERFGGVAA